MLKHSVIVLGVLGCSVSAFADAGKPVAKPSATGDHYIVGSKDRRETLSQQQFDEVMKTKTADVEGCWKQLPDDKRKHDVTATLRVAVDDNGEVQTVDAPALPPEAARCVSLAAASWAFPQFENQADAAVFSYALPLRAK